jgi:rhamnosyl/mannosyltransferase
MACGTPVLNTAISGSGVPWVSPHELTGLTVPINDHLALAAAANRLLNEPGLARRLGAAAKDRARREFDHRIMARRSLAAYERVLAREQRIQSTWSFPKPMLTMWKPAPAFKRLETRPEAQAGFAA